MAVYRLPFDDDGDWQCSQGNWDDPVRAHPLDAAYALDFPHAVGANIRASRSGTVVLVENNAGNSLDSTHPSFDPSAPQYGTAIFIRHTDGTVAVYMHLQFESPTVEKGQFVFQGEIIALSGDTGHSSGPHLHYDLRVAWNSLSDWGQSIPFQFEDKNHSTWRPKSGDALASNNSIFREESWHHCGKCHGLFRFHKGNAGKCPFEGMHLFSGGEGYILTLNSDAPGQPNWRRCTMCKGLFFNGSPASVCPAGGAHIPSGNLDYSIIHDSPGDLGHWGWKWCNKCQGMFFGEHHGSRCPAGGEHNKAGSGNYMLTPMGAGQVEDNWRWCPKCKGLFFGGNSGSNCPAGGEHSDSNTNRYLLARDYTPPNAPGQPDWRRCDKCQGLFFGGNPESNCPEGGKHQSASSPNYTLVNAPNAPGEKDWRWCFKCQGLFRGLASKCPTGGAHSDSGSGSYSLLFYTIPFIDPFLLP